VHGIVKGHGGAVTVTSEEGRGTTFQLYFPAVDAPADAAAHSAPQLPARGEVPPRVLLVDDEVAIVGVFTRALERLGFQVTPFTRPSEALAAIRASGTAFDIVVTDHRMPEVTGIQLAREIRRLALRIPIVMMSGHLSDELLAEGAKVEITRFISKPCSVESLGEVLLAVNAARDPGR